VNTQYFQQPDGKISYNDSGSGPLVICIPSIGDVREEYRFLAPQLVNAGFRVIQMDLRGLGQSSTGWDDYSLKAVGADLLALIRSLDAGPAYVIGTSMASGAAVWASVEQPESIAGLVLIGPAVHGEVRGASRLLYSLLFSRPWGPSVWVKYYRTLYPTRKPDDFDQYTAVLLGNLREKGRIEAVLRSMLASKYASEERLPRVNLPVKVIMGSLDPDFKDPEREARWVADLVRAEYHIVQGAGHYPHAEMPEITGPLVVDFLRAHQPENEAAYVA
jgi:pimeloyl-ACP methyl ester carboxylesterase